MPLSGRRIFVTGGAGFIGTALARRLVEQNELVVLDNLHRDSLSGSELAEHPNLSFVRGDVRADRAVPEPATWNTPIHSPAWLCRANAS